MNQPVCLGYIEDENLRAGLQQIASENGFDCFFAERGEQLSQLVKRWVPFMLVADLCGTGNEWLYSHIAAIDFLYPEFPMAAVIPDHEEQARQRVESYGCRYVMAKSEWPKQLSRIIVRVLEKKY